MNALNDRFSSAVIRHQSAAGLFNDFMRGISQVLLQQIKGFVKPLPRPEFFFMVKLAGEVIVKNNKVVARVKQDPGWAFIVATPEFLGVVLDMSTVETETKAIDGNRVVFFFR